MAMALPLPSITQEVRDNMKKNILLLLLLGVMLTGCEKEFNFYPRKGGKYVPWEEEKEEESQEEEGELITCTYNFYFSYTRTTKYDEVLKKDVASPVLTVRDVNMFAPLGKAPEAIDTGDKLKAKAIEKGLISAESFDSTFSKFLGYSYYSLCLDEEGLWNFESDMKQQAIINLYGVWVSE